MTTSLISQVNSSSTPLGINRAFIGRYDTVTNFLSAIITINTDTDCELSVFQSNDRINSVQTIFETVANVPFTQIVLLTNPYFYITVRNTDSIAQTSFALETIYRPSQVVKPSTGGVASNVNIQANIGGDQTLLDGVAITPLFGTTTTNALQVYQPAKPRLSAISFSGVATGIGKANILASFSVQAACFTRVCLYGTVSALEGGTTPVNIYIAYRDAENPDFFTSSLGAISIGSPGDFSRDFETSAPIVGFYVDSLATLDVYYGLI
jgi:hypothetical protein